MMSEMQLPDTSEELSASHQALLVKQADWLEQNIHAQGRDRRGLQIGYLVTLSVLCGWLANAALKAPLDAAHMDAYFMAARLRPDMTIVLCAVCVVNSAFFLLSVWMLAVHARALEHLQRVHNALMRSPAWIRPSRAAAIPQGYWQRTTALAIWVLQIGINVGCLWFARPAAKQSVVISVCWWVAALALAYAARAFVTFIYVLRKMRALLNAELLA